MPGRQKKIVLSTDDLMEQELLKKTQELIVADFELSELEGENLSEDALFQLVADQVAYWIEHKMEFLLSLMYRLDIDEAKVNYALSFHAPEPANIGIAKLILERQKRRVQTKMSYKPEKLDDQDTF